MEEDLIQTVETEAEDLTPYSAEEETVAQEMPEEGAAQEPEAPQEPTPYPDQAQDWVRWRKEQQRSQAELDRLTGVLEQFGYAGSAQEMADSLEAAQREISPEEVRQERELQEAAQRERDALEQEQELHSLRQREAQRVLSEDLTAVQAVDKSIKRLDELGQDFFRLRAGGCPRRSLIWRARRRIPKYQAPAT